MTAMTDRATLLALADRVEGAAIAGRGLDAMISCALRLGPGLPDWAANWSGEWKPTLHGRAVLMHNDGKPGPHFSSLTYTASLDAAMTLVPAAGKWSVTAGHKGDWQACVWVDGAGFLDWRTAATPALALCAAALRARAEAGE